MDPLSRDIFQAFNLGIEQLPVLTITEIDSGSYFILNTSRENILRYIELTKINASETPVFRIFSELELLD